MHKLTSKLLLGLSAFTFLCFTSLAFATYGQALCKQPGFSCHTVKKGETWTSLWPNEDNREIVMRVNRLNIYLRPGLVLAVPNDLSSSNIMEFAPFDHQIANSGQKTIIIDPAEQAWGAYDESGTLVRWGPASGGRGFCQDTGKPCTTPIGDFYVYTKGGVGCASSKFPIPNGGAPMPYCMYFKGGAALHGEPYGLPGYNASHGCVRTYVDDAEWLNHNFVDVAGKGHSGTRVIVKPYGTPNFRPD